MKMKPEKNQVTWGITIFVVCVCLMLAYYVIFDGMTIARNLGNIVDSLSGIIIGIVIAYILIPLLEGVEHRILMPIYKKHGYDVSIAKTADKKKRSQMRKISILITMTVFLILLYSLFRVIIPQLVSSIREIANNLPMYIKNIDDYSNLFLANNPDLQQIIDSQLDNYYETLSSYLTQKLLPLLPGNVNTIVRYASRSFISGIKIVFDLVVGLIVAIYVLNSKERFTTKGKKMAYAVLKEDAANELISGFRFVNYTFQGFIGGKLVDSLIIGVICYIGCIMLKIPYPVLISVVVGATNVIPFFGPYIGGGVGALILVLINPVKALVFLIFVIVLQQFDGNILGPTILGNSTGLSSFWVIFAITLFGGLWGVVGLFIGVPIFAVFYAFVSRITNVLLARRGLDTRTNEYADLAYIEDGEYKLLSDKNNTKHNARKNSSAFKKLFHFDVKAKKNDKKTEDETK
ncbi:MAG: AI-2E family transporter [Butyrivibrio sp.]|uniref:AI-2E family transporter n=1 Tax=Butyrivibrio sp. TaxID=28121 RepID=UPI0025B8DD48|nr:AI-2E family transporter [Butyrivibrio sp.]MBQ6588595.1 AI-2E family transporter [Butyrivibrio sp.]